MPDIITADGNMVMNKRHDDNLSPLRAYTMYTMTHVEVGVEGTKLMPLTHIPRITSCGV